MAIDRVKMILQTPNKRGTCFKHYEFLNFDEKQQPKKFCSTDLQISLVQGVLAFRDFTIRDPRDFVILK